MHFSLRASIATWSVVFGILLITLIPYKGNVTALFHMDTIVANRVERLPSQFVVLQVPSYDGAQYFELATNMPLVLSSEGRAALSSFSTKSYAAQRFLLPFLAFLLSMGRHEALAWSFLIIQLLSLFGAYRVWRIIAPQQPIIASAAILGPAAMLGLHFQLAEPLMLFCMSVFLERVIRLEKIDLQSALVLGFIGMTREIGFLFIVGVALWVLLRMALCMKRQQSLGGTWKELVFLLIPISMFVLLHAGIYAIFGEMPFFLSTSKVAQPFLVIVQLAIGSYGYTMKTITSLGLLFVFVLPALFMSLKALYMLCTSSVEWASSQLLLVCGSLWFLGIMIFMPDHIWGSITSIGRVITPAYPFVLGLCARTPTPLARMLPMGIILLGVATGLSLAFNTHPFLLSI